MKGSHSTRTCVTPRCGRPVRSVFAAYCTRCRRANQRTGAAFQKAVRKSDLKPFLRRAKKLVKLRNAERIEAGLRTVHAALLAATEQESSNRYVIKASDEIAKVLKETAPLACGLTIAAVALLQAHNPRYFATDKTFDFALVRAFRAQGSLAFGSAWDHEEQRARLWYRVWPERSTAYAAMLLKEFYAPFVAAILTEDSKEALQAASARAAFNEGFKEKKTVAEKAPRGAPRKGPLVVSPLGTPAQTRRSTT